MFTKIYLASSSPRRRELLQQIGIEAICRPTNIDETPKKQETPRDYVNRLAQDKLNNFITMNPDAMLLPSLAADTIVTKENLIIGKPNSKEEFYTTMAYLSDTEHSVLTAISIHYRGEFKTACVETQITFAKLNREDINYYWENYHPLDKAGGYGIQEFAAIFVKHITGSYSNIVGLPLYETHHILKSFYTIK